MESYKILSTILQIFFPDFVGFTLNIQPPPSSQVMGFLRPKDPFYCEYRYYILFCGNVATLPPLMQISAERTSAKISFFMELMVYLVNFRR